MKIAGLLLFICAVSVSHASVIQNQEYLLLDHPDGALTGSGPYGLRVDSIAPPTGSGPTFSVSTNGASVILEWIGSSATISGQLWNNTTNQLWGVSQTFSGVTSVAGGFQAGNGELILTDPSNNVFLFDATPAGNVFTADDSGHRCNGHVDCGPLTARGWIKPKSGYFEKDKYGKIVTGSNDWLVQLTPVPVPAALPLLISGLLGFSFFSRRKATIT